MSRPNTLEQFWHAPSVHNGLEVVLDPMRHSKPGEAPRKSAVSICQGWKSWLPPSPLPLDGACQLWAGQDPWKKELPTAETKKNDFVIVGQTVVDCSVYAIPGVVGGVAIVDSIIADPDNEDYAGDYV
mmetsp:Transcript_77340/g.113277  ORF Transcript_77340/g.113277 Transcript_77340/m.113277 type:complete len:128 (+) Transcript_77340:55-438(+)|eukprot:CAMPEP_0179431790 /NCGR_PEP_ID=MMETSP0799-20121207/16597_1 /TAXON_ID=46947 /ORGANISM="Geminigera cryophila, Strain CCMP2564" /LENGTH=127 /DNA_ID=CAMNT_0021208907 /DNA_START=11 /DNA_END=394 /DNA_ORIENTATION=-